MRTSATGPRISLRTALAVIGAPKKREPLDVVAGPLQQPRRPSGDGGKSSRRTVRTISG